MLKTWKDHCPISEEDHPVQRQAWKRGWGHRLKYGPGEPDLERVKDVLGSSSLVSVWLQGYNAADSHLREQLDVEPEHPVALRLLTPPTPFTTATSTKQTGLSTD